MVRSLADRTFQLRLFRQRLRIWSSSNLGATWEHHTTIWEMAAGYSSLVVMGSATNASLGLLYDRNNYTTVIFEAQGVSFTNVPA